MVLEAEHPLAFLTDAEVLQELVHRYVARRLWPQGREASPRFSERMQERVAPGQAAEVERAAALSDVYHELASRDLLRSICQQFCRSINDSGDNGDGEQRRSAGTNGKGAKPHCADLSMGAAFEYNPVLVNKCQRSTHAAPDIPLTIG